MNDENAFQAALDAHPDDHTTRLVFADWLEEHDDPRAEPYRILGKFQRFPARSQATKDTVVTWSWYLFDPDWRDSHVYSNGLPPTWSRAIGNQHVKSTRLEADEEAVRAFLTLEPSQRLSAIIALERVTGIKR